MEAVTTLTHEGKPEYFSLITKAFSSPTVVLLFLAASLRHTAGFTWLRNNVAYFHHYHPMVDIGYWSILTAIIGGCVGVFTGGVVSDMLVSRLGTHSRLVLLSCTTLVAAPAAALTLYLDPPLAFIALLVYYFFGKEHLHVAM